MFFSQARCVIDFSKALRGRHDSRKTERVSAQHRALACWLPAHALRGPASTGSGTVTKRREA